MPRKSTKEPVRYGKVAPARTPEEQENLMIGLSMQQAERMLREGHAPTGVVMHFLRLATQREQAAVKKLNADADMSVAKAEYVRMQQQHEQDYNAVVEAFRSYGGNTGVLNSLDDSDDFDFNGGYQ